VIVERPALAGLERVMPEGTDADAVDDRAWFAGQNAWRGTSAARKRDRRNRLINAAVKRHGLGAVSLAFESLEDEYGELGIDRRLEHLVDADPRALALFEAAR
jgi:hypothetical protein